MNNKEYITSGILELYVAGALSEKENEEVHAMMLKHTEVTQEVLSIEAAILNLTAATAHKDTTHLFKTIKEKLQLKRAEETKVIPLDKPSSKFHYVGWAAAAILAVGLVFSVLKTNDLQSEMEVVKSEKEALKDQIFEATNDLTASTELLDVLRTKDIISIPLGGQAVSPESYAKVYWDKKSNSIYLDLQGLPEPPEGKVYQIWSLTLNPLTPTSLGTLDSFTADTNKIFTITNANQSEAFGITLEPAGGSISPTLEQLYTLGAVSS